MKRLRRKFLRETQRLRLELEGLIKAEKLDYKNLDIVTFAERVLKVKPFPYQAELLRDSSKRLVAVMGRQSGKTTTIAIKAIHLAIVNDGVTILITSPSLRQSMIMFSRISTFVFTSPLKSEVVRSTRTTIQFDNRSEIIALPASENLLRGYTAHMIICLPYYTKVALADGRQIPIREVRSGDRVLSFNLEKQKIELKEVVRVYRNPLRGESLIRIRHEKGFVDCTGEHRVFTLNRGYVPASLLTSNDRLIYLADISKCAVCPHEAIQQTPIQTEVNHASRTTYLRRAFRRLFNIKAQTKSQECQSKRQSFLKTSCIRRIQVFHIKRVRQNPTKNSRKQRMGEGACAFPDPRPSGFHRDLSPLLQRWKENNYRRVVVKDKPPFSVDSLVHGRWESSPQLYNNDKYPQIHVAGTKAASSMAEGKMGSIASNKSGLARERLLSKFLRGGKGQIFRDNQTLRNSKHAIQDYAKNDDCNLPSMREKFHPEKKCSCCVENHEEEPLLQFRMQQKGTVKASLQPLTHALQNLWKSLRTSHRQSSHMQQRMQPCLSFTTQAGMESCLQTPQVSRETENMPCLRSSLYTAKVSKNLQSRMPHKTLPRIPSEVFTSVQNKEKIVYNLEVEGNHNYFADGVLVSNCDEAAFMPEELITNVIFPMISTTDGYAIFLSTPWDKNHFFYKAFMDPNYSVHRVKSSECPLIKPEFLEEMKRNMTEDAYRMEYEAEFVEEANTYFSKELIRECVDPALEFLSSLEKDVPQGECYGGCDFGKLEDFSVIVVLKREVDFLKLVYLYEFPIGTPYSNVIGHLVRANQKFKFRKVQIDQTGVGEPVLEELKAQGVPTEGLTFTIKAKEELLSCLKIAMEQKRLKMPYNRRLCEQINEQQYAYSKSGHLQFSHPAGSHDDILWALALGVYAATIGREEPSRLVRAF